MEEEEEKEEEKEEKEEEEEGERKGRARREQERLCYKNTLKFNIILEDQLHWIWL